MKRLLYHFRIIFKTNVFLGIFFKVKRKFKKNAQYDYNPKHKLVDLLNLDPQTYLFNQYLEQSNEKQYLLKIADDFTNGNIEIYNTKIKLKDYTVDRFHINRTKNDIYNKDIRFQWEVYRSKFLYNVGMAYAITSNKKYARAISNYIGNWEKYTPIRSVSVRYNGMESSIKLINLSFVHFFLKSYKYYEKEIRPSLTEAIVSHANYTYLNYDITVYGLESNHALSCAVGLIYASYLIPNHENSKKWNRLGNSSLKRSLKKQFRDDGVNFESSTNYHCFIAEMLLFVLVVLYNNEEKVEPFVERKIIQIFNCCKSLTHSNKMISRFGDSDGGKFLPDIGLPDSFAKVEYIDGFMETSDSKYFETLFFDRIPKLNVVLNEEYNNSKIGDYYTFKVSNFSLIFNTNGIGTFGKGNHQHNDFLSFELYGEKPFIVDPWSYCYTGNSNLRNLDRSTNQHNTIKIDDREIVPISSSNLFEMVGSIKVNSRSIVDNHEKWIVSGTHNGYKNLKNGKQNHNRKIIVNKSNNEITIIDTLDGIGKHTARLNYHIQKRYWKMSIEDGVLAYSNDYEKFTISNNIGEFQISQGYISIGFLEREPSCQLYKNVEYEDYVQLVTKIIYSKK